MSATMQSLVSAIFAAKQELSLLFRDRDSQQILGKPCSLDSLAVVQRRFARVQRALPPSYQEFLMIADGWRFFSGELHLLSGKEQEDPWVKEVARLSAESAASDPFSRGMVPVGLIENGVSRMVFLDLSVADASGEAPVLVYFGLQEDSRHASFRAYLEWFLETYGRAIDFQKNGDPAP